MKNLKITFGLHVRTRRRALGLTQAELAEKIDLSEDAVSQIERGKIAASFETIGALTSALKTTPAELFGGRPMVSGKQAQPIAQLVDRLMEATPAQLKIIRNVVDGVLDE